jgi:hypothetical protein
VPSTSVVPSLRLSFRRAEKTAFWMVATGILALVVWLLAAVFGTQRPWAWAAVAAAGILLPRLLSPQYFEFGIRAWNKLMRVLAPALRAYVLRVTYVLLIAGVARTGSSFDLTARSGQRSMWVPRGAVASRGIHRQLPDEAPWYRAAARGSGWWTMCLLPVVLLLRVLENEELEDTPPSATYTLY